MLKGKLLKRLSRLKHSNVLCIFLLKRFVESTPIDKLDKNDDVSFKDYLTFIQNDFPRVADLFTAPYLMDHVNYKEISFINEFLRKEKRVVSIVSKNDLRYKLDSFNSIPEPASTLTLLPDGNILSGTCYYDDDDDEDGRFQGEIVLRDPSGKRIRTLVNKPASTLTLLPDGNILCGTCYSDEDGRVHGKIVIRHPSGKRIRTLVNEPASTLTLLPDGNILSGTCYSDEDGHVYGQIVLRDPSGQHIRTLVNEPASTLTLLPDGNILSGTCYSDDDGHAYGEIMLRNPSGERIRTLADEPASTLTLLSDGNILSGTCYYDYYGCVYGEIAFRQKPLLVEKKLPWGDTDLLERINKLLVYNAAESCNEFHKGWNDPGSRVSWIPMDVLLIIYSYVFPPTTGKNYRILNRDCFPYPTEKDVTKILLADEFAKKIPNLQFFKPPANGNNVVDTQKDDKVTAKP